MAEPQNEDNKEVQNLKILKSIVIGMGVILVVGTFALFIMLLQRSTSSAPEPTKTIVYNTPPSETPAKCNYKNTQLDIKSPIIHAQTEGDILTVVTQQTKSTKELNKVQEGNSLSLSAKKTNLSQNVIIVDLCSGEKLSEIEFIATQ